MGFKIARYIESERISPTTVARGLNLSPYDAPLGSAAGAWIPKALPEINVVLSQPKRVTQGPGGKPTVIAPGQMPDGRYPLMHLKGTDWWSNAKAYAGSETPQGDVRAPLAAMGAESAELLGVTASSTRSLTTLGIPDGPALRSRFSDSNTWLRSKGKPTFAYQLLDAGLIEESQLAATSLKTRPGFEVGFAFAIKDPKLRSHEVSYHLGMAAMMDKPMGRRVRNVTQVFEDFAGHLDAFHGPEPVREELAAFARAIRVVRSKELDVGMANAFSYSGSLLNGVETHRPQFNNAIGYMLHPEYRPGEALVRQVRALAGEELELSPSKLNRLAPNARVLNESLEGGLAGTVSLENLAAPTSQALSAIRNALYRLDGTFEANQRPGVFELMSTDRFARNVLAELPERYALLNDALRATAGRLKK